MSDSYEYRVGRGKDCNLVVRNPFISREHALPEMERGPMAPE